MNYTYRITTYFSKPTFYSGKRKTVHGTLNRAVAIWNANHPQNRVEIERAPVGEYEPFDMEAYIAGNDGESSKTS